jgi:hypothetical protein
MSIELMKDKGIYEDCSMVCYPRLNSCVVRGDIDEELKKLVDIVKDWRVSVGKKGEE